MTEIKKCITSAQACMLLLVLKEHLKEMYGLTDGKISRYSPSEQKLYEKAVTRRSVADFNPRTTVDVIKKQQSQNYATTESESFLRPLTDEEKLDLVVKYLDVSIINSILFICLKLFIQFHFIPIKFLVQAAYAQTGSGRCRF